MIQGKKASIIALIISAVFLLAGTSAIAEYSQEQNKIDNKDKQNEQSQSRKDSEKGDSGKESQSRKDSEKGDSSKQPQSNTDERKGNNY